MRLASAARLGADARGRAGAGEDMALVLVLAEIVSRDLAFQAARRDHRHFALEGDEAFEDHRRRTQRAVNRGDVGPFADQRLALAVVTEPPGLEDRRAAELGDRAHQRARVLDADKGRDLMAEIAQERLFRQPVLSERQSTGARTDRHALRKKFDRRRRHVLPLEGDDVDTLSKARKRRLIVEGGDGPRRRRVIGRRFGLGGENVGAQARP